VSEDNRVNRPGIRIKVLLLDLILLVISDIII